MEIIQYSIQEYLWRYYDKKKYFTESGIQTHNHDEILSQVRTSWLLGSVQGPRQRAPLPEPGGQPAGVVLPALPALQRLGKPVTVATIEVRPSTLGSCIRHLTLCSWALVVAQLAERLLSTPEICGSKPNISENLSAKCII